MPMIAFVFVGCGGVVAPGAAVAAVVGFASGVSPAGAVGAGAQP